MYLSDFFRFSNRKTKCSFEEGRKRCVEKVADRLIPSVKTFLLRVLEDKKPMANFKSIRQLLPAPTRNTFHRKIAKLSSIRSTINPERIIQTRFQLSPSATTLLEIFGYPLLDQFNIVDRWKWKLVSLPRSKNRETFKHSFDDPPLPRESSKRGFNRKPYPQVPN